MYNPIIKTQKDETELLPSKLRSNQTVCSFQNHKRNDTKTKNSNVLLMQEMELTQNNNQVWHWAHSKFEIKETLKTQMPS